MKPKLRIKQLEISKPFEFGDPHACFKSAKQCPTLKIYLIFEEFDACYLRQKFKIRFLLNTHLGFLSLKF